MSVQRLFFILFGGLVVASLAVAGLSVQLMRSVSQVNVSHAVRYYSRTLAEELRQSSDDLTRMARTYAVTGDSTYEEMYWRVLAIRDGEVPRPQDYEYIYWDFVSAGRPAPTQDGTPMPLRQLMIDADFTPEELEMLAESQNRSDDLVWRETVVMNAVQGIFVDAEGEFTVEGEPDFEMASRLMHDAQYHDAKANIMAPIDQFLRAVDQRTSRAVDLEFRKARQVLVLSIIASVVLMILVIVATFIVRRRVGLPIREATQTVRRLAAAANITVEPIVVGMVVDEVGQLTHAFESMHDRLTQEACEREEAQARVGRMNEELERRVATRTEELRISNAELEGAKHAAEAANRAKGAFLASMSHEIRTPLHAILGNAQLLGRDETLSAEHRGYAHTIAAGGERLNGLLNGLMSVAKAEGEDTHLTGDELPHDTTLAVGGAAGVPMVTADEARTIPQQIAARMIQASIACDHDELIAAVDELAVDDRGLAARLRLIAGEYDYDVLLQLLGSEDDQ